VIGARAGDPRSAGLPSGTVSFLFTDIEGSTRLLQQLGGGYGDVLADHHRLLRAAFEQAGGREMGTEGDAFFVAFRTARDVVAAAAAAQRALAGHPWPAGAEVRVRMGIHTGEPAIDAEGYRGLALHRAARISAAGHGGQVLLSNATRELVEDDLPAGLGLRDLGEQWLKDLERPERIFQLTIDGCATTSRL
jgi:class 3 adenylate cyclase